MHIVNYEFDRIPPGRYPQMVSAAGGEALDRPGDREAQGGLQRRRLFRIVKIEPDEQGQGVFMILGGKVEKTRCNGVELQ